ncbi:MAG: GNAT family N-acetyltransferase [Acidimicrobiaceae bacterium]|nr:GNAT family N-acetyltransferase [Acidimicrobiaceae bacterium]
MAAPLPPVTLTGSRVRLEPLSLDHADDLHAAASAERSTYDFTWVPDGPDEAREYIASLLADHAAGAVLPFAQIDVASNRAVGCTRFLEIRRWRGRDVPDEVEIGGTWLARAAQGTGINTEAKYLLLGHAFEAYGVWRVQIVTDARNALSRGGIESIGATFEGILRNHRFASDTPEPSPRQTAVYSIIRDEWPDVRAHLRRKIGLDA